MDKKDLDELKHQLLQIEKEVYRIEQDTIKLSKKLDEHISFIDRTYEGLKNPIQSVKKFFR